MTTYKGTPETTNLVPMTYSEAARLFRENGKRPFSFVAAPYGVLKTAVIQRAGLVAAPPSSVNEKEIR
jgi:hypothetical protein